MYSEFYVDKAIKTGKNHNKYGIYDRVQNMTDILATTRFFCYYQHIEEFCHAAYGIKRSHQGT
ncbi:MAG: hypothetical protein FWG89_04755 [Treponema sp.]|nr:hypothetical protein [Treponema sp.]